MLFDSSNSLYFRKATIWKCNFKVDGVKNVVDLSDGKYCGCRFEICGNNNSILLGANVSMNNTIIRITGSNNRVVIGTRGHMKGLRIWLDDDENKVLIEDSFSVESGGNFVVSEGTSLKIHEKCMFSTDVEIRTGDGHAIYDKEHNRINRAEDVEIGNHVWIGAHVRILKGAYIPNDTVVGNSALVTKKVMNSNCILAGIPAKVVKDAISWTYDR